MGFGVNRHSVAPWRTHWKTTRFLRSELILLTICNICSIRRAWKAPFRVTAGLTRGVADWCEKSLEGSATLLLKWNLPGSFSETYPYSRVKPAVTWSVAFQARRFPIIKLVKDIEHSFRSQLTICNRQKLFQCPFHGASLQSPHFRLG